MLYLIVEDQTHGTPARLSGRLLRCLAHYAPSYSGVGASGKPGAAQIVEGSCLPSKSNPMAAVRSRGRTLRWMRSIWCPWSGAYRSKTIRVARVARLGRRWWHVACRWPFRCPPSGRCALLPGAYQNAFRPVPILPVIADRPSLRTAFLEGATLCGQIRTRPRLQDTAVRGCRRPNRSDESLHRKGRQSR